MDRLYAIKRPVEYHNNLKSGVSMAISACWALDLVPTIPIWFDTTLAEDWGNGCKCYFPLRNVSCHHFTKLTCIKSYRRFGCTGHLPPVLSSQPGSSSSSGSSWPTTLPQIERRAMCKYSKALYPRYISLCQIS